MLRVYKLIRFYKKQNLLREKISLSLNELEVMYPFLSKGEAILLYTLLQKIKNPAFEFKHSNTHKIVRRYKHKMTPEAKKEIKPKIVKEKVKNPKAPNRYDNEIKNKAYQLYQSGKTVKEIEKILGTAKHKAIRRWLKSKGVSSPNGKH